MKVSLFVTCLGDQLFPQVGESVVRVLNRLGVEVDFPLAQTCCGQPAFNSGYKREAKEVARHTIEVFSQSEYVVLPSGSCTGMIHHYYPYLFQDEPEWKKKAEAFIEKTYEFCQFLVKVLKVEDVGARYPVRATFHPSCHASRLLGVKDEPLRLLKNVKDLELIDLPYAEYCCGFGGTFSVKMSEMSNAMVEEKVRHVLSTQAEVLISTDAGCLMNIGGKMAMSRPDVRIMHVAEILDKGMSA